MNDELRVKDNELGGKMNYRYRTDDENALADSILKMYEEPQKIPEMGKFAEEKNETVFSWKTSAKKLLKFLETDF